MSDPMTVIEIVARAICKSRTCEGFNCCQWPANAGRIHQCTVPKGGYDDASQAAITAVFDAIAEPTPGMLNAPIAQPGTMVDIWRAMLSARFAEILGDQK